MHAFNNVGEVCYKRMYTEWKIKRINIKNYGCMLKLSMNVVISRCYLAEDSMDLLPKPIKF